MFLSRPFYIVVAALAILAVCSEWLSWLYAVDIVLLCLFLVLLCLDAFMLRYTKIEGNRHVQTHLDLGEQNTVSIRFHVIRGSITAVYGIDEVPTDLQYPQSPSNTLSSPSTHQSSPSNTPSSQPTNQSSPSNSSSSQPTSISSQLRSHTWILPPPSDALTFDHHINDHEGKSLHTYESSYSLLPNRRGRYELGRLLLFTRFLGFLERRIVLVPEGRVVEVYPAFSRLRDKDRQARSQQVLTSGMHRRQQPSNQTEFKDIREYVFADDIRTVNWKATARAARTMVNTYEDERSQMVINIIDCSRTMHRTFDGLMLQDYAVNAALLLSYSALTVEGDSAGLLTYGPAGINMLPPHSGEKQLKTIMHHLYNLETEYGEGDLEEVCLVLDRRVQRRSIVVLHTDFSTLTSLERQLPFLRRISRRHNLVVVMFIDRELQNVSERVFEDDKTSLTKYVERSFASDLVLQKIIIAEKLQQQGIHCVLTYPEQLSFAVVRKYLELRRK